MLFLVTIEIILFLEICQNLSLERTNIYIINLSLNIILVIKDLLDLNQSCKLRSLHRLHVSFMTSQRQVDAIYFDLSSSFYIIPHFILLHILGVLGFAMVS
jgi:hypothetical protein